MIQLLWVNMMMDSFALICMPTILSLYICSPLNVIQLLWVAMIMDSIALMHTYVILSLCISLCIMQSLKRDPVAVGEHDHGFVCVLGPRNGRSQGGPPQTQALPQRSTGVCVCVCVCVYAYVLNY